MDDAKQVDDTIRNLTGCTGRPFLCDGFPMGCRVALVGINPGTPTDFWSCWNGNTGCNKAAWIQQYLRIHGHLKPTRDRIEAFCNALLPERCLELNLTHHYTPDEGSLSTDQIEDTRVFSYMIQTVRPEILFVHGNKPIAHLERVMTVFLAKQGFTQAVYQGVPLQIYAAKSHFSRGVSRQYVIELADEIRGRLSPHVDLPEASGRPMNVIGFRSPSPTVDLLRLDSKPRSRSGGDMTKLNTIFRHIAKAQTNVCRRSKSNIKKLGGSIFGFRQQCGAEGYFFAELGDDVYAIKTKEALDGFLQEHPDADVR